MRNITVLDSLEQGSEEWLKERSNGIGSSEVSVIMGLNPWKTPYELYHEKVTGESTFKGNEATDHGTKTEPEARKYFEDMTGKTVKEVGLVIDNDRPYLRVSPDGMITKRWGWRPALQPIFLGDHR